MNKAESMALLEEVKVNIRALDSCAGPHDFVGIETEVQYVCADGGKMYRRFSCTKCGGKIISHDRHWYERGLKHGRESK
jgi:DNA-directed RNA polymerase subunit RPC12/RpoP